MYDKTSHKLIYLSNTQNEPQLFKKKKNEKTSNV